MTVTENSAPRPCHRHAPHRRSCSGLHCRHHPGRDQLPCRLRRQMGHLLFPSGDFTPVCTSEFMTFASMQGEFASYNTELVGLSVDGLYSHIAWLRTIKDKIAFRDMHDVEVTFPLIDDVSMAIAQKYGMIMPAEDTTKAVRAVFVIDPQGVIRTVIYYPQSLGRNFDELLRIVKALQTADHFHVATPADWRPGEPVIVPPAGSCGTAKQRMEDHVEGVECEDWFFCTKQIPADEVESAIRVKDGV